MQSQLEPTANIPRIQKLRPHGKYHTLTDYKRTTNPWFAWITNIQLKRKNFNLSRAFVPSAFALSGLKQVFHLSIGDAVRAFAPSRSFSFMLFSFAPSRLRAFMLSRAFAPSHSFSFMLFSFAPSCFRAFMLYRISVLYRKIQRVLSKITLLWNKSVPCFLNLVYTYKTYGTDHIKWTSYLCDAINFVEMQTETRNTLISRIWWKNTW